MIDLHCHSHYSDGTLSPEQLISQAVDSGLSMLALTDHDTVAGLPAFQSAAKDYSLIAVNGIELSVRWKKYDLHILGLNIDPKNHKLNQLLDEQQIRRRQRAQMIAEALEKMGVKSILEKAKAIAGTGEIGRPHFAHVLVEEGYVKHFQEAFTRFLGRGAKAYVPTQWLSVEEAVWGITSAGGHAVIAHPHHYKLTRTKLNELIILFKEAGGTGIEVVSGEMNGKQIAELCGICERFGLLASTGSDYHGDKISKIRLGQQPQLPLNCKPVWQQWI